MSKTNGPKQFLYVVRYSKVNGMGVVQYLIFADRDPTAAELFALFKLDARGSIEAERYDLDAIPKLPPKSGGG